jgi:hypothetical protein
MTTPTERQDAYCQQWNTSSSESAHGHLTMSVECGMPAVGTRNNTPACKDHLESA